MVEMKSEPYTITFGIIGAGRIGKLHADNLLSHVKGAKLKTVTDPFLDEEWVASRNIPVTGKDHRIMLDDPEIDAILIGSPSPEHAVQLALKKGDAVFFSPALFHAAGTNFKSSDRIANLIQASSAFGKTMESVDRTKMTKLIYQVLLDRIKYHQISPDETKAVCSVVVDGYSFPTNLDLDSPMEGSAPGTVLALINQALNEEWPADLFCDCLDEATKRRLA